MRIPRLFIDQDLEPGTRLSLDAGPSHYLARVLKLRAGRPLVMFNGDGSDYAVEILSLGRKSAELVVNTRLPAVAESPLAVTLVQAISRGERMDYTLQKATELGVASIQTLFTERVEVKLDARRLASRMAHWQGVINSACEQCGRATVPGLLPPVSLQDWTGAESNSTRIVLAPGSDCSLSGLVLTDKKLEVLIRPEGGLTDAEVNVLDAAGVTSVSLGPRVLRTETAGPAAIAVLQAMAGDL